MTECDGFLIFLERTALWKDFFVNAIRNIKELSFFVPKIHSISTFSEAAALLALAPHSFLIAEIVPDELSQVVSGAVRLKNHDPGTRFAAFAPELMKMSPVEYDRTWELLFQSGFFAVTTSFEELTPLAESVVRHFKAQASPEQSVVERIWDTLPWRE